MKRLLPVFLILALLALCGCTEQAPSASLITVSLAETPGCTVLQNGLRIESGSDAVFEVAIDQNYVFSSVDYSGEYTCETKNGRTYIRLHDVRYPTLATVRLTCFFCSITYQPNGGEGKAQTVTYDKALHIRPNTSIGTDMFSREGHTLVSWNTKADGSGTSVGLGSRVSVPGGEDLTLYAQWAKWSPERDFEWSFSDSGVTITRYRGSAAAVVIPARIGGIAVTAVGSGAFSGSTAQTVILPQTVQTLQDGAFSGSGLRELTLFDNIVQFGDAAFADCPQFSTLHINAIEAPYGYDYRRESCLADKVDILIEARGQKKLVFYGGCSMWYNLDGRLAQKTVGEAYRVINLGLNGTISSAAQMQILTEFLEEGDIFLHTPELSSQAQLLQRTEMIDHDRKLWSGLEYNYDLVSLLDLRTLPEFFDIFHYWLSNKECTSSYTDVYRDSLGNFYVDPFGCASFPRQDTEEELDDPVTLDPKSITAGAMDRLEAYYEKIREKGAVVYVSYACVNMDAVPEDQRGNVSLMDGLFRDAIGAMEDVTLISRLSDYLYHNNDFYDTNYHLLTDPARRNTILWLRDLREQMTQDGLWPEQ